MSRTLVLIIVLAAATAVAAGGGKPCLMAKLWLVDRSFHDHFTAAEIEEIESRGARRIDRLLAAYFPCFDFVQTGCPDSLLIRIEDPEPPAPTPSGLREVAFRIALSGPHVLPTPDPLDWTFWQRGEITVLTEVDPLVAEIEYKFASALQREKERFTGEALVQYSIADTVLAFRERACWVLPFTYDALAASDNSIFAVRCMFDDSGLQTRERYEAEASGEYKPEDPTLAGPFFNGIVLRALPHPQFDYISRPIPMTVLGLYLKRYVRAVGADGSVSPDTVSFGPR